MEARNYFCKGAGAGTIKCALGFNHHGVRNKKINSDQCIDKCLQYNEIEDWKYVISNMNQHCEIGSDDVGDLTIYLT